MTIPCIQCKGKNPKLCGREFCPIVAKAESLFKTRDALNKDSFAGSSPAPFVGRFGYPEVNVGILAPPEVSEDAWIYDSPKHWAATNISIEEIASLRSSLINSRFKANVKAAAGSSQAKLLELSQEIGMASKPVDVELKLKEKPVFKVNTDSHLAPMGPNAKLEKAEITSTPKIHTKVDRAVSATDLKSTDAIVSLYHSGFDENFLAKLLSIGNLGIEGKRRLVPTRWSITATDDLLAKNMLKEIRTYAFTDYLAFFDGYLGNYYLILCLPEQWSYELFESYLPKVSWNTSEELQFTTDYEPFAGRKDYAEACAGGYYTVRLAIAEKLAKLKKQANVLALRFITGEYAMPLGVWTTREASRRALAAKPISFGSKELLLSYAKQFVKNKFGADISPMLKQSIMLKEFGKQQRLANYF
jgi:hypothetical protein